MRTREDDLQILGRSVARVVLKWIWHDLYTVNERNDAPWILESVSTVVSSKSI